MAAQQLIAAGDQIGKGGVADQGRQLFLPKIEIAAGQLAQIRGVAHRPIIPQRRNDWPAREDNDCGLA
jgi:hypothetical protein